MCYMSQGEGPHIYQATTMRTTTTRMMMMIMMMAMAMMMAVVMVMVMIMIMIMMSSCSRVADLMPLVFSTHCSRGCSRFLLWALSTGK